MNDAAYGILSFGGHGHGDELVLQEPSDIAATLLKLNKSSITHYLVYVNLCHSCQTSSMPIETEATSLHAAATRPEVSWERWHELLDIEQERPLTELEQVEYREFEAIASLSSAKDRAIQEPVIRADGERRRQVVAHAGKILQLLEQALAKMDD